MDLRLYKKAKEDLIPYKENIIAPVSSNFHIGDLVWIPERRRRGVIKYEPENNFVLVMVAGAEYDKQISIQFNLNELELLHGNNGMKDFSVGEAVKWNGKYLLGDAEDKNLDIVQYNIKEVSNVKIDGGIRLFPANGACYTIEFIYKGIVNYSRPVWPENLESLEVKNYGFKIK